MKNVTLDRAIVLQLNADGTDSALDAATAVTSCTMTLPLPECSAWLASEWPAAGALQFVQTCGFTQRRRAAC